MKKNFTVVMSVYKNDNPEYLILAIDSLVNQTVKPDEIIIVSEVARAGKIPRSDLLDTEKLVHALNDTGRLASCLQSVDNILEHILGSAEDGDVICILSNGGFENLHERLIRGLKA